MHATRADLRCSSLAPRPAALCGWDIGGAHLKAVGLDSRGGFLWACQAATALWQGLDTLQCALRQVRGWLAPETLHVLTLTGEGADCFPDRASGVHTLLDLWQGEFAAARAWVYAGVGGLHPLAANDPERLAEAGSRNHLATAELCARLGGVGILADMGSSTTDFTLLRSDGVHAMALDDAGRLATGELVYQGLTRTPLVALGPRVPFDGHWQPLMNEHFATSADIHRLLGQLDESCDLHPAADAASKTLLDSARRLARMLGRDLDSAPLPAWQQLAGWFAWRQRCILAESLCQLASREPRALAGGLIATGVGSGVLAAVARDLGLATRGFAELAGEATVAPWVDRCAPAYACARLRALTPSHS
ncbi:MAG TPA: hypothetical protein DCY89_08235 [Gammaproteobacteria bacterium]|nr:hypothetical protein [Gammaproteobacteria bacterium]